MPLPVAESLPGGRRRSVARHGEMGVAHKVWPNPMPFPAFPFHKESDADELPEILKYTFMCNKPVAILTDASFWGGYGDQ